MIRSIPTSSIDKPNSMIAVRASIASKKHDLTASTSSAGGGGLKNKALTVSCCKTHLLPYLASRFSQSFLYLSYHLAGSPMYFLASPYNEFIKCVAYKCLDPGI